MSEEPATAMNLDQLLKEMTFPPSYSDQISSLCRIRMSPEPRQQRPRLELKIRRKKQPPPAVVVRCLSPEPQPATHPRYRLLRLWKVKPGRRYYLEEMRGSDAILKHNGRLTRTPLPVSCPLPPDTDRKYYLIAQAGKKGDIHRINVKWVPVQADRR